MKKLAQVDKNFAVRADTDGLCYRDITQFPELYYGLFWTEKAGFYRMNAEEAAAVNQQVSELATCTAGGRLRFVTNSKRIALQVQLQHPEQLKYCLSRPCLRRCPSYDLLCMLL